MSTVLLFVHITATLSMIVLILLQRSEGGALGMGGGGGGLVSGRGAANLLTRITAILAAIFFTTSLSLGVLSHRAAPSSAVTGGGQGGTPVSQTEAPTPAPIEKAPETLPTLKLPKLNPETPPAQTTAPVTPAPAPSPQLPQAQ